VITDLSTLNKSLSNPTGALYAFYDFEVNPNCFDFVKFAVLADCARSEHGNSGVHFVFVPSKGSGFREDDQFEQDNREWRLRNIMLPVCSLVESCVGFAVCASRDEARTLETEVATSVFPAGYTIDDPIELFEWSEMAVASVCGKFLPSLRASGQAMKFVESWLATRARGRKIVTITLREMGWQQERNSRVDDWLSFAAWLDHDDYFPVFIRDTDALFTAPDPRFDGVNQFPEAALNLEIRAALYESSYLNMMVSNGPIEVCALNTKVRFLMFKVYPKAWAAQRPFGGLAEAAVPVDGQLPISGPHQRFVWDDDELDVLKSSFTEMIEFLESNEAEVEAFRMSPVFPPTKMSVREVIVLLVGSSRHRQVLEILEHLSLRGELKALLESMCEEFSRSKIKDPDSIHRLKSLLLTLILSRADHPEIYQRVTLKFLADGDRDNDPDFRVLLGDAHAGAGNIDEAIQIYLESLEMDPSMIATNVKLGMLFEQKQQFAEAEQAYLKAMSNGLKSKILFEKLAQLVKLRGSIKESIEYSMLAVAADSNK
jgi:tetratricopeptide (TPR) repeat protein